jgi:hypothetical protein
VVINVILPYTKKVKEYYDVTSSGPPVELVSMQQIKREARRLE